MVPPIPNLLVEVEYSSLFHYLNGMMCSDGSTYISNGLKIHPASFSQTWLARLLSTRSLTASSGQRLSWQHQGKPMLMCDVRSKPDLQILVMWSTAMRGDIPRHAACYCCQNQLEAAMGGLTMQMGSRELDSCTRYDHLHEPLLYWSGYLEDWPQGNLVNPHTMAIVTLSCRSHYLDVSGVRTIQHFDSVQPYNLLYKPIIIYV